MFHVEVRGAQGRPRISAGSAGDEGDSRDDQLKPAFDDLGSITSTKFRHNFLRFNVTPADLDWFDDHEAVVNNARLAAEVARAGNCAGILLDTEQYQGKLFDFHKQRDASRRTWSEYAAQARRRGREVMLAFQEGFPDLTVFLTFGHSLVWKQSDGGKKPIADCKDGLLVPFLDGMIEASKGKTRLVDGHEMSYGYRESAAFTRAYDAIKRDASALASDRSAYHRLVSAGFGLWLDYDWPKNGWNTRTSKKTTSLQAASRQVFVRPLSNRTNMSGFIRKNRDGGRNEAGAIDLPREYVDVVRRVRRALLDN